VTVTEARTTTDADAPHVPQPGEMAPPLALRDGDGTMRRLADERGKWVIVYFYPTDDTPGCTTEACAFRDSQDALREAGAVVWGISAQGAASHQRFTKKYDLNFPLLVDSAHEAGNAWGTWQLKSQYGRDYMGTARTTFLIDPKGRIARTWERVKAAGHAEEVLAALREEQAAAAAARA
jgi:thioredoxin-dependent peroxiredoxin